MATRHKKSNTEKSVFWLSSVGPLLACFSNTFSWRFAASGCYLPGLQALLEMEQEQAEGVLRTWAFLQRPLQRRVEVARDGNCLYLPPRRNKP